MHRESSPGLPGLIQVTVENSKSILRPRRFGRGLTHIPQLRHRLCWEFSTESRMQPEAPWMYVDVPRTYRTNYQSCNMQWSPYSAPLSWTQVIPWNVTWIPTVTVPELPDLVGTLHRSQMVIAWYTRDCAPSVAGLEHWNADGFLFEFPGEPQGNYKNNRHSSVAAEYSGVSQALCSSCQGSYNESQQFLQES